MGPKIGIQIRNGQAAMKLTSYFYKVECKKEVIQLFTSNSMLITVEKPLEILANSLKSALENSFQRFQN